MNIFSKLIHCELKICIIIYKMLENVKYFILLFFNFNTPNVFSISCELNIKYKTLFEKLM